MRTAICPGVTWVGVKDPELKIFDIVVPTEFGTTYNSYLIQGEKATALIDTSKMNFSAEYFANLEKIMPLEKIDYVVVQHTEPDHAGCLLELIRRHPNITVIHSRPCTKFIENLVNCPFHSKSINNGDEIDLGGKTLRFFVTPFLHWPDTMVSYLVEDQVLFSCDVELNVVGRKAAVFSSCGWSGEGITMTKGICEVMHMKVVQEPFKVQMTPSATQLDEGRQWGYQFGLKVIE